MGAAVSLVIWEDDDAIDAQQSAALASSMESEGATGMLKYAADFLCRPAECGRLRRETD